MTTVSPLDRRLQAYLRAYALRLSDHERVGCFLASFDAGSDNPFRNYAVPDDGAEPTEAEIAALVSAFVRRKRKPRLEYIAAAAPFVEPALVNAAFEVERRLPVMTCRRRPLTALSGPHAVFALAQNDADIVQAAEVGASAYGSETPHPDALRRLVAQGGVLGIARDSRSGRMIGAGVATPPNEGVTEIVGIGVLSDFRRRGIAGALTALLAGEAFARGASLAWLTPGDASAQRIYARAGFVPASEQLHISKPP